MPRYQVAKLGVKGVIFRRGRVLLLHRRDDLPIVPGLWDMPGGGVEVGDSLEDSLVREVREETGFTARVGRPIHAWIASTRFVSGRRRDEKLTSTIVCYECSVRANGSPRLDPREHTAYSWVPREDLGRYPLPPNQLEAIKRAFDYRKGPGGRTL
jgi:8-oxo-dGTP diphosphatase